MIQFFTDLGTFIQTVVRFVINFIPRMVQGLKVLAQSILYATEVYSLLPPFLAIFAGAVIVGAIVHIILEVI